MSYWFPPNAQAFDPIARPLVYAGPRAAPVPNVYDAQLLAMATVSSAGIVAPPLIAHQGIGGAYWQMLNGGPPPWSGGSKTTKEKLHGPFSSEQTFTRWWSGDLPDGGLPPDTVNPDGSFTVNYWDMSDDNKIRRKARTFQVFYFNNQPEVHDRIVQWNRDTQAWEDEGQDAEREIMTNGVEIVKVCGAVAQTILAAASAATGGLLSPVASAFAYGWQFVLQYMASQGQVIHVSMDDLVLFGTTSFLGAVGGSTILRQLTADGISAFNGAMTKAMADITNTLGSTGVFGAAKTWGDSIAKLSSQFNQNVMLVMNSDEMAQFSRSYFAGQSITPPQITPKVLGSAVPDFNGINVNQTMQLPPTASDPAPLLPLAQPLLWAGLAYGELDPNVRLQIRRNFFANWRGRATIVASDDVNASAHAINITQNTGVAVTDLGSQFDQALITLIHNGDKSAALDIVLGDITQETAFAQYTATDAAARNDLISSLRAAKAKAEGEQIARRLQATTVYAGFQGLKRR